jgi:hypothetical protein
MAAPLAALRLVVTCALGLTGLALAPPAVAGPFTLRAHLTPRSDTPLIGRYETDEGGVFVLDRSAQRPLLKFEDDPEIWVLQPAPGPRGDVIYRNDLGEEMLRATSLGGMTVFTEKRPGGSAAALDGASAPLRVASLSPAGLFTRFYQASVRVSRAAQHQIAFETRQDAEAASAAYLADAAVVASEALVDMASRPQDKAMLAHVVDVVIAQGGKPNAAMQHGVLTITIVPSQGVFGRPSSRKIERAAGAH